jgi:hypothetical protein
LCRPFDLEPEENALMVVDVAKAQNIHFRQENAAFLAPFYSIYTQNHHFAKTGTGQT